MQRTIAQTTGRFERKREAILDAATLLLNQHGVKGLTLGDAAAAVGLSTTSVTYYFKRKDDLAGACMLRGIAAMDQMAQQALMERTPETRLAALLDLYLTRVRHSLQGRAPALPVLADLRALNPPALEQVSVAYSKLFRRIRQIFDGPDLEWLSRGRKTARTHLILEQLFWAGAWLPKYDAEDDARVRDRMIDVLVNGLAAPEETWRPAAIPLAEVEPPGEQDRGREVFLLAATRLINARGYRGASVDKISAELKVTKGSFYHHNEAKDDLVVACFKRSFEVERRVQRIALALPENRWVQLSSAAAALAEFQLSDRGPLLRISALWAVPQPMQTTMLLESMRVADRFCSMISDGIAEGSIRPVDAFLGSQMLAATLNAGSELGVWVPGVKAKAAPAVLVRPLLMGLFSR